MRKNIALFISCLLFIIAGNAQTKVFKEVSEEISSQVKAITQDNALVGYLVFTKLEKVDENNFNYKITIMDENLNDIGTVKFTEANITLQGVSFEQDVLCLAYTKMSFTTIPNDNPKKKPTQKQKDELFIQFISLDGKIIGTHSSDISLTATPYISGRGFSAKYVYYYGLKHGLQVRNIAKRGFAVYYGDQVRDAFMVFDTKGSLLWTKKLMMFGDYFYLHTSGSNIYILTKSNDLAPEGGYTLHTYSTNDTLAYFKYDLKDKKGDWLKVLTFDNDPNTGKAYLTGCIINPDKQKDYITARDYSNGPYLGLFTLNVGNTAKEMAGVYSYWNTNAIQGVSEEGLFTAPNDNFYVRYSTAFKDYDGNTVFAGSAVVEKKLLGIPKYKLADGVFIKQDAKAQVKLDNNVECDETSYFGPAGTIAEFDKKGFYKVTNNETKTNYIIIDDDDNTFIYNVNAKKIMRTIQHKEGKIKTNVFPAKEGHVMISEYNKKEKYTRFSIEAL